MTDTNPASLLFVSEFKPSEQYCFRLLKVRCHEKQETIVCVPAADLILPGGGARLSMSSLFASISTIKVKMPVVNFNHGEVVLGEEVRE